MSIRSQDNSKNGELKIIFQEVKSYVEPKPYKISTITIVANLLYDSGEPLREEINFKSFFCLIPVIPEKTNIGITRVELFLKNDSTLDNDSILNDRNVLVYKKLFNKILYTIQKSYFPNQLTFIFEYLYCDKLHEVHVFLFKNGKMRIVGINETSAINVCCNQLSQYFCCIKKCLINKTLPIMNLYYFTFYSKNSEKEIPHHLLSFTKKLSDKYIYNELNDHFITSNTNDQYIIIGRPSMYNSAFDVLFPINLHSLFDILYNEYNLTCSSYEPELNSFAKIIFYWNYDYLIRNDCKPGVCYCNITCTGTQCGKGNGKCKKITAAIYQSGKISISGANHETQIRTFYDFLNSIFKIHYHTIYKKVAENIIFI